MTLNVVTESCQNIKIELQISLNQTLRTYDLHEEIEDNKNSCNIKTTITR